MNSPLTHPKQVSLLEEETYGSGPLIDMNYILAVIRRNRWLIFSIVTVSVAAALAATLLAVPQYTARVTIQVNETSQRVLGSEDTPAEDNSWNYERFLNTEIDVVTSYALAERVENALDLSESTRFFNAFGIHDEAIRSDDKLREMDAILLVQRNLKVPAPRNTRVIPVLFTSADAGISAQIANSYAEQFIQADLKRKFDSTAYARDFVSDQLTEAKERLANSEKALNTYARGAGLIRLTDPTVDEDTGRAGGSITTASLIQLNQAANSARANRIGAETRWQSIANAPLYSSASVRSDPTVASLLGRRAALEASLAEESSRRLEDHPEIVSRRAELAQVQADLNAAANSVRLAIRTEYDAARATEIQLASQVNTLKGETLSEQDSSVQYALLEREADTNRQLYDELLQRYKQLNAAAGVSASNISIIDQARVPVAPSSPNLMFNLGIGFILGSFIAGGAVFLRTELDDSIRVPEDVAQKLDLPLLGVVPVNQAGTIEDEMADPKAPIAEAYSSLCGSLLYATPQGLAPTMLVTSSQPSEGKSVTCRALAHTFSRMGRKVILVDGDIRRPSLHRFAGTDNSVGLTTVLTGQATLAEAVHTNCEQAFSCLTAGPTPPAPSELLASVRMQEIIDELAREYDLVIIDSSPVLGLADAPMLSVLVDGVVFVVEAARGRRGALKSSLRRLKAMRPNILGAVLTKFDPKDASNSYSSYYGYDYYSYRDEREKAVG
ncbi:GumC family protein [Allopontixanthobacter sp.]|uniref:GumC family protein n=1 Tax=Allopontixanthobacter sp. TaxID=2906452 RepID=UPI002AB84CF6|nr:polysaccharide biosynthesis tyrosine autokinase [Allopontixanthobacter sp.]MDZ4307494.1 polysaccharide biosynthesis tyrosine autokinase [Allopontixanthobacter sp.]